MPIPRRPSPQTTTGPGQVPSSWHRSRHFGAEPFHLVAHLARQPARDAVGQLRDALAITVVEENDESDQQQLQQSVAEQPHEGERQLARWLKRAL